jgi:hypothetical protein
MANQAAKISSGITQTQFNSYIGEVGRLFYNLSTGELRISDGQTPKGLPVYVAVGSANIGNLLITNTTISTLTANANITLATTGVGGSINVQGELVVYQGGNIANVILATLPNGTINFYTPNQNSLDSAIDIIGTPTGEVVRPIQTGVMLHVTGQPSLPSRLYNDGINNYALFVGRRVNGTAGSPTAVSAGDDIVRYGANPYNSAGTFPTAGVARIAMTATENQTDTSQGTNISIWTTAIGTAVIQNTATFDSTGLTIDGNVSANYINSGNFSNIGNVTVQVGSSLWTFDTNSVLTVPGNVIPQASATYTLGDSTHKWADVWIGPNTLNIEDTATGLDASLTVTNGVLKINGANQLQVGQLKFIDNTIESTTGNIDIQIGTTDSTANLVFNRNTVMSAGKTFTAGNVIVNSTFSPVKGITHNVRLPANSANVVVDFLNDDLVRIHTPGPGTTMTANLVNLSTTVGKTVEVWVMSPAGGSTQFNHGVSSSQSTNANSFFLTSRQSMYIKYFNLDGTTGNLFVTAIGNNTI